MVIRIAAVALALVLMGCGGDGGDEAAQTPTPDAAAQSDAAAVIAKPKNRSKVSSPVTVKMRGKNVKIEEAGDVVEGSGHFHLMVDAPCVGDGEVVPDNKKHLHFGDASKSTKLKLAPGKHKLCLQLGNGAHEAFGKTDKVTITVK